MFGTSGVFRLSVDLPSSSEEEEEKTPGPSKPLSRDSLTDKTIVLDMDLTLICTIGDGSDISHKLRTSYTTVYGMLVKKGVVVPTTLTQFGGSGIAVHNDVVKRPGVDEFLLFCRIVFKNVILWSAGQANYVYDTVKLVLDPQGKGIFDHVYTANDVVKYSADRTLLRTMGPVTFSAKPLTKIADIFPDATLDKTILVDDLQCNFIPNPRNGVLIPPFSPNLGEILSNAHASPLDNMARDTYLFSLIHFLADDGFINAQDVRQYDLRFF